MSAMPALALAGVGAAVTAGARPAAASGGRSIASSSRPGSARSASHRSRWTERRSDPFLPSALDDAEDSKPYVLAAAGGRESRPVCECKTTSSSELWRRQLGGVQKFFRVINQTAYLISIPFLMILLLGIAVRNRQLALLGATAVVLLNIARLVAGGANLAVVPFRDGIDLKKMKKPLRRVIEPAVTIGLVVLAFTFIPWLSTGKASKGTIKQRIVAGAESLSQRDQGRGRQGRG